MVELLLQAKANPGYRNASGFDGLMSASHNGQCENMTAWLRRFPTWELERKCWTGFTALHYAVWGGKIDVVERLLAAGASREARDLLGNTPLHLAAFSADSSVSMVNTLLADLPDGVPGVNVQQRPGRLRIRTAITAIRLAVRLAGAKKKKTLPNFLASSGGCTPLHLAASRGDVAVCRALLEARADPNIRNWQGRTALDFHAQAGLDATGDAREASRLLVGLLTGAAHTAPMGHDACVCAV